MRRLKRQVLVVFHVGMTLLFALLFASLFIGVGCAGMVRETPRASCARHPV